MSDFDPVAYLNQASSSAPEQAFDPHAYLHSAAQTETYDPSAGGGTLSVGPVDTGIKTPQWLDRFLAGAGKASVDLARGAGERVGLVSPQEIAESRKVDAPLMATTAGKVGNIVGNIADTAPTTLIPGANTALGATLLGAGVGALQPTESNKELRTNVILGAGSSLAGQQVGSLLGKAADKLRQLSPQEQAMSESLQRAKELGLVVPPSTSNPTIANQVVEGLAGKLSTAQQASVKNQSIINGLARSELGLAEDMPLTHETMAAVRQNAAPAYQAVASLPDEIGFGSEYEEALKKLTGTSDKLSAKLPNYRSSGAQQVNDLIESLKPTGGTMDGETAVELSKNLRSEASSYSLSAARTGSPQDRMLGRAYRGAAEAVENAVEDHLTKIGQPELAQNWDSARRLIAKSYSVQNALDGAGNVDATKLGKQLLKGKPLSGNLEAAANFANTFPKAARAFRESMPGISPLDVYAGAGLEAATQNPWGLAIGPARWAARQALLSPPGQVLANPGATSRLAVGGLQGLSDLTHPLSLGAVPLNQLLSNGQP